MERKISALLILIISCMLIFCGCGKEDTDFSNIYNPKTDSKGSFAPQGNKHSITESGNGYYLYYADKADRTPVILCNKPNCLHIEEMDQKKVLTAMPSFSVLEALLAAKTAYIFLITNLWMGKAKGKIHLTKYLWTAQSANKLHNLGRYCLFQLPYIEGTSIIPLLSMTKREKVYME